MLSNAAMRSRLTVRISALISSKYYSQYNVNYIITFSLQLSLPTVAMPVEHLVCTPSLTTERYTMTGA